MVLRRRRRAPAERREDVSLSEGLRIDPDARAERASSGSGTFRPMRTWICLGAKGAMSSTESAGPPSLARVSDPLDPRIEPYRAVRERDLVGRAERFIAEGEVVLRVLVTLSRFG